MVCGRMTEENKSYECPECGKEFDEINDKVIMHRWDEHGLKLSEQLRKMMKE